MIWPLYYAVIVAIVFAATRFRYRTALGLLTMAVLVQAVDLAPAPRFIGDTGLYGFRNPLNSRFWDIAAPHYQRLILIPSNLCERNGYVEYSAFALLAGRHRMAINSGMTARYDVPRARVYCGQLDQEVRDGLTTAGSLYVVRPGPAARVAPLAAANGSTCTAVDGFGVCFSADSYRQWRQDFEIPRAKLPPTEEFVRFYAALERDLSHSIGAPRTYRPGDHRAAGSTPWSATSPIVWRGAVTTRRWPGRWGWPPARASLAVLAARDGPGEPPASGPDLRLRSALPGGIGRKARLILLEHPRRPGR